MKIKPISIKNLVQALEPIIRIRRRCISKNDDKFNWAEMFKAEEESRLTEASLKLFKMKEHSHSCNVSTSIDKIHSPSPPEIKVKRNNLTKCQKLHTCEFTS